MSTRANARHLARAGARHSAIDEIRIKIRALTGHSETVNQCYKVDFFNQSERHKAYKYNRKGDSRIAAILRIVYLCILINFMTDYKLFYYLFRI